VTLNGQKTVDGAQNAKFASGRIALQHHCLPQPLPKARQEMEEPQPQGARVLAPRLNPPHAPKAL
jgi:hypothetical protein